MSIFRLGDQQPPAPRQINDEVVMRFDDVYEVDSSLMELTGQQPMPAWDTQRIVDGRWDYLVEIDVGIWEQRLNEETWSAWVDCKREISEVTLAHGGSITACHGATRAGDAELVPTEMGTAWPVVKAIKRALDPNNVMNPGKQSLDEAYE